MKVGIDAFTIREVSTDPIEQIEFAADKGFEGIQFDEACYLGTDAGKLRDIVSLAREKGLYTYASVDVVNYLVHKTTPQENAKLITEEIKTFSKVGWHELRTRTGGLEDRGPKSRAAAVEVMKLLRPVLEDFGSRINFENHGDCTTSELIRMIEEVGDDIMGINFDTANTLVHAEDPVLAAKRCVKYIHSTHAKDGILFFTKNGITRQSRPAGQGVVDWDMLLPILYAQDKDLPISVEDHKWLFEVAIYDAAWIEDHPDLGTYELSQIVKKAQLGSERIFHGDLMEPEQYEKTPFVEEMVDRLNASRNYLKDKVSMLQAGY